MLPDNMNNQGNVSGGLPFAVESPGRGLVLDMTHMPDNYVGALSDDSVRGGADDSLQLMLRQGDNVFEAMFSNDGSPNPDGNSSQWDDMSGLDTDVHNEVLRDESMYAMQQEAPFQVIAETGNPLISSSSEQSGGQQ